MKLKQVIAFLKHQDGDDCCSARITAVSEVPDILEMMADGSDAKDKGQAFHSNQYSIMISSMVGQGNPMGTVSRSTHRALLNDMHQFHTHVDQVFVDQQRQLQNLHQELMGSTDKFRKRNYVFSSYKWRIDCADARDVEFIINNRHLDTGNLGLTGNIKEDCLMYTDARVREDYEIFQALYHVHPRHAKHSIPSEFTSSHAIILLHHIK